MEEVVHLLLATFFIVFYLHKCTENSLFTKKVNMNGYHTVLSEGETMNLPAVIVSTNPERCFNWGEGGGSVRVSWIPNLNSKEQHC